MEIGHTTGIPMRYESGQIDGAGPQNVMQDSMMASGAEVDGIAGVLWDAVDMRAIRPRDSDVIYRLYRQEMLAASGEAVRSMRGRCFISEPQRPYTLDDRV